MLRQSVIRFGLETLYFSGVHRLLRPVLGGVGAIAMLHHVRPARPDRFQPNRGLEITPQFLNHVLSDVRRAGIDIISLDEMHRRMTEGDFARRFVCITIDDGYRDILQHAYPVFKRHDAPFAIYVATGFADRLGELWWLALEAVIARNDHIALLIEDRETRLDCRTLADKRSTYDQLYAWLCSLPTDADVRAAVRELAARYSVDIKAFCAQLCMTWGEIAQLASDPLVTVGAHTVNHVMLRKVSDHDARAEMQMSQAVIEAALGSRPLHLAYPFGDRIAAANREFRLATELGFKTATTTRPGVLYPEHRNHLMALPRLSLNGHHQSRRHARVLLSGAPTAIANRFRRLNVA